MQRHKQASVCCRYRRHGDQPGPVYRCVPVSSERPWFTPVDSAETTCRPWIKIPSNINIPRSNPLRNRGTFQGENPQCKPWVGSRPGARLDGGGVVTATMDAQRQQRRSSTLRVLDAIGAQTLLHSRLQMSGDHERTAAYIRHGLVRPLLSASPPGPPLLPLDRGLPSVLRVWSSGSGPPGWGSVCPPPACGPLQGSRVFITPPSLPLCFSFQAFIKKTTRSR